MGIRSIAFLAAIAALAACGRPADLPPDRTAPTIATSTPADGATASPTAAVSITFSERMNPSTVTVTGTDGVDAFDCGIGTWSNSNMTVTFAAPPAPLGWGSTYAMTVNGKDAQGNAMTQASFSFNVSAQPVVTGVVPVANTTGVIATDSVSLTFSVPADHASVESAFSLTAGGTPTPCVFSWSSDSKLVSCAPPSGTHFAYSTAHTLSLASTAKSAFGDTIDPNSVVPSTFTTAAAPPTTPPTVTRDTTSDVGNVGGFGNVSPGSAITIAFSRQVSQAIAQSALQLTVGGVQITPNGTFSWDATGTKMSFKPSAALTHSVTGTWSMASGIPDTSSPPFMTAAATGSFHVVGEKTDTLLSEGSWSGCIISGTVYTNTTGCWVGDDASNNLVPTLLTFDLAKLTSTPTAITSGQLKVTWVNGAWGDPKTLPGVQAQSVKYAAGGTAPFPNPTTAPTLPTDTYCSYLACNLLIGATNGTGSGGRSSALIGLPPPPSYCRFTCPYTSNFPSPSTWALNATQSATVTGMLSYQWGQRASRSNFAQFRVVPSASNNNSTLEDFIIGVNTGVGPAQLDVKYEYAW
jgi:hypothetical protein